MTRQRSFKRLVRARMAQTGESYTAARAILLAAEHTVGGDKPPLITSDAAIKERTGRGWEQWLDLLDTWGAIELTHREIARRVAAELQTVPLDWHAQAIAVSYERTRGLRAVGERADGFAVSVQRTTAVPVEHLFDLFVDPLQRGRWLADADLRERTSTRARSARFDWANDESRVNVTFESKRQARSTVTVEHARLADADQAAHMKAFWRDRLDALTTALAERADDA